MPKSFMRSKTVWTEAVKKWSTCYVIRGDEPSDRLSLFLFVLLTTGTFSLQISQLFRTRKCHTFISKYNLLLAILCIFIFYPFSTIGQTITSLTEPSPEAEMIHKVSGAKIDYASGKPDIAVPLFSPGMLRAPLAINLRYSAEGFKPNEWTFNEISSNWGLDCKGIITRTIKHYPDDSYDRFMGQLYLYDQETDEGFSHIDELTNGSQFSKDTEYDLFQYSFMGQSGTFIIDYDVASGKYKATPTKGSSNKIEIVNNNGQRSILSIRIITDNGDIYTFGAVYRDKVNYKLKYGGYIYADIGWYLEEIKIANTNKTLKFNYQLTNKTRDVSLFIHKYNVDIYEYGAGVGRAQMLLDEVDENFVNNLYINTTFSPGSLQTSATAFDGSAPYVLKSVELPEGTVELTYTTAWSLESLFLKDKSNTQIRKYNLVYNNYSAGDYRRRLLELQEISTDSKIKSHKFSYFGGEIQLPTGQAFTEDPFGYASGQKVGLEFKAFTVPIIFPYSTHPSPSANYQTLGNGSLNSSLQYTRYGVLSAIKYPTGGETQFDYELHEYDNFGTIRTGGGLRIKSISNLDNGTPVERKTYIYSPGSIDFKMGDQGSDLFSFLYSQQLYIKYLTDPNIANNNSLLHIIYNNYGNTFNKNLGENRIRYSVVKEYDGTVTDHIGYREFRYQLLNRAARYSDYGGNYVFKRYLDKFEDWKDCLLTQECTFSKENHLLKRKEYYYQHLSGPRILNSCIFLITEYVPGGASSDQGGSYNAFLLRKEQQNLGETNLPPIYGNYEYEINTGGFYVSKEREVSFSMQGDSLVTERDYSYGNITTYNQNDSKFWQLSKISETLSNGKAMMVDFLRPSNFAITPYIEMTDKNMLSPVLEEKTTIGGQLIKTLKNNYFKSAEGYYLPLDQRTIFAGGQEIINLSYISYDTYGNIREIKEKNQRPTVILWGYNGKYPVARIDNATYAEVLAVLGQTAINNLNSATVTEESIRTSINTLRNHLTMQKAEVSTYSFKPLIGMTSSTDQRGIVTSYQFDGFQRLKNVLDFNGYVLKDYLYNYRP